MKKIEVGDAVELFINGVTSEDSFKVVRFEGDEAILMKTNLGPFEGCKMRYPTSFVRLLEVEA